MVWAHSSPPTAKNPAPALKLLLFVSGSMVLFIVSVKALYGGGVGSEGSRRGPFNLWALGSQKYTFLKNSMHRHSKNIKITAIYGLLQIKC